jgi:hypothetical protein
MTALSKQCQRLLPTGVGSRFDGEGRVALINGQAEAMFG